MSYGADFKSGGYGEARATGFQENFDFTRQVNEGADLGVANPDIASADDITQQGQSVGAGAFGGHGGQDNVAQTAEG